MKTRTLLPPFILRMNPTAKKGYSFSQMKTRFFVYTVLLFSLIFLAACSLPFPTTSAQAVHTAEPTPAPTPQPTPAPTPTLTPQPYPNGFDICGRHYEITASELDLSGISDPRDIGIFREIVPFAENLRNIQLGSEAASPLSWTIISQLQEIAPGLHYSYSFSLYGEPMTLDTEYINLRKIPVTDDGAAVVAALPCMKNCKTLDMDSCGVDNEHMAAIRDAFPQIKVIWRVRFSTLDYSVRTDVKTILASLTGEGPYAGITTEESALPLTYCTEVINLDLGHNNNMRTLSFLRYMPDLEVFITYNNFLRDVDDLAYCKKLRYLELYGSSMYNINSIAELDELTDLQLSYCYNLEDISPIIPADKVPKLRRLFLTPNCIPDEQIEAFKANHPDCYVNTTDNSSDLYWRSNRPNDYEATEADLAPGYRRIREIFHYSAANLGAYSLSSNDPYYTTPQGQPVTGEQVDWFYGVSHYDPYGLG